jgi:prepilin-type processing-associated H-X9-DG protein
LHSRGVLGDHGVNPEGSLLMHRRFSVVAAVRRLALVAALVLALTPLARAQDVWFAFEMTDPSALVSHPKDAGLRAALAFLPDRLLEVAEMTGAGAEVDQLRPLLPMLGAPMRMAITGAQPEEEGAPPVLGVVMVSSQADRADAQGLIDMLEMVLEMQGLLVEGEAGALGPDSLALMTPMGPGSAGVVERDGRFEATLLVGEVGDDPFASLPAAEGTTIGRMRLDLRAASWFTAPLMERAAQEAGPGGPMVARLAEQFTGEFAPIVESTMTRTDGAMQSWTRIVDARKSGVGWLPPPDQGLTSTDLRAIPARGAMGGMVAIDLARIWEGLAPMLDGAPGAGEALEEWRAMTGVDFGGELLPALGPGFGFYSSVAGVTDATPTALTVVAGVRDRETVRKTFDALAERADEAMAPLVGRMQGLASVRMTASDEGGARLWTLHAPGLPLPFVPTIALTDDHLIVCFSKTAARAAIAQSMGRGDSGAMARPEIATLAGGGAPISVFYMDTPPLAAMGYPLADMLTTALAGGVAGPDGRRAIALPAIPPYDEWRADIRPLTSVTVWEGDDAVRKTEMDGAMLTTMAGGAIAMSQSSASMFMLAGILAPALEEARESARVSADLLQVRTLQVACLTYVGENNGRFPASLDDLVRAGFVEPDMLESPFGSPWDGGPDYFLRPDASMDLPPNAMTIYSRSSYSMAGSVNVGFLDGSVAVLTFDEFFQLLDQPANAEVEWQLP